MARPEKPDERARPLRQPDTSNGIEPAFSWRYERRKLTAEGGFRVHAVEDHAWRLYWHLKGADAPLTPAFVTALQISAQAHVAQTRAASRTHTSLDRVLIWSSV